MSAYFPDAIQVVAPGSGNLASTLNAGLALTTSTFVARIDQDDIALPDRLEKQVEFLERANSHCCWISGLSHRPKW